MKLTSSICSLFAGLLWFTFGFNSPYGAEVVVSLILARAYPENLAINVGDTVTWVAEGESNIQLIKSYPGEFTSPFLDKPGASYSFTFKRPGVFPYRHVWHVGPAPYRPGNLSNIHGGIINVLATTNSSPAITINTPLDGFHFGHAAGNPSGQFEAIPIMATPSSSQDVVQVEFYSGTNLIGVTTNAPFSLTWTNAPLGTNALWARAEDRTGTVYASKAISVVVEETPAPRLRDPRILPGGIFVFDYVHPPFRYGIGYFNHRTFNLENGSVERMQQLRGSGTIITEIEAHPAQFFWIQARF